jgi:hypothetical protein
VTAGSGNELQAAIDAVNAIKQSNLNGISSSSVNGIG